MGMLFGRDEERAAIEALLDSVADGARALVLAGDPGIGKTALWREGLALAERRGFRVLGSRPTAAEAKLTFASLADLLRPLADEDRSWLPVPQREALDAALLLSRPAPGGTPTRAVGAAVQSLLERAAQTSPLLVAIDDVQWLDRATAAALTFALRRLDAERVALLVTQRGAGGAAGPLDLELALARRPERIVLAPLSLSAIFHVVRAELGVDLPRPLLRRIEQTSGGNPFFALELARAIAASGGTVAPGAPLPVPERLGPLLRERLARLGPGARRTLLAAALLSVPTRELLAAAVGAGEADLQPLLDDEVLVDGEDTIRFGHPLLADAVVADASAPDRREMHARLAEVTDAEERAHHRALAGGGPQPELAAELTDSAAAALGRGAPEAAVDLLEMAIAATPAEHPAARAERTMDLAAVLYRMGDTATAQRHLDGVLADGTVGPQRGRALEMRAQIDWVAGSGDDAVARCLEALRHADGDEHLRARASVTLARVTMDPALRLERAAAAVAMLDDSEDADPRLIGEALVAQAGAILETGADIPWPIVDRGLALEEHTPPLAVSDRMSASLGVWLKYRGEFEQARTWLRRVRDAAVAEGDESSLPYALSHLPQLELWTGDWAAAEAAAREHLELAELTGQSGERLTALYNLTTVDAHAGRLEVARARIAEALPEAEAGDEWNLYQQLSVLGFVELSAGEPARAVEPLMRAIEMYERMGADLPQVYENAAEALVRSGDLATAAPFIDRYLARARAVERPMLLAPALRATALLRAAHGDLDGAAQATVEAMTYHDLVPMPFSRARTMLVAGQVHRRRGERRAARSALEEARAIFAALGARAWAEATERELQRIPTRRRADGPELTDGERRVAELVAIGLTNREVADRLFVTAKTVEANLTRIYAKLGVRTRAALAARLADGSRERAKL